MQSFLKEPLINKKKLEEVSMTILNKECSVILHNKPLRKLNDLGVLLYLSLLVVIFIKEALADLGASINAMQYSILRKVGLKEP